METTSIKSSWPNIKNKSIVKINSLINIIYENEDDYWEQWRMPSWWMKEGRDPWTVDPIWGDGYIEPDLNFDSCVKDNLRWKCGYSFVLRFPENFRKNKKMNVSK